MIGDRSHRGNRSAFTLVELIVVLLIIAILVSLLTAAVSKVLLKIPEVQTRTEISEMELALRAFMSDYNLDVPPPSYLVLNEQAPLASPSAAFLQKVFGKNLGAQGPVDWNGDGAIDGPWTLEGGQCLVFYLGGIPNTAAMVGGAPPGPQGFSSNNMNPALPGGNRKGPYFTFQTARLIPGSTWNPNLSSFFVYLDPWKVKNPPPGGVPHPNGTPYAYFSSYGINNGYSLNNNSLSLIDPSGPYTTAAGYTNSNTYQIISAGRDGVFGGGLWNPSSGATGNGADDQANFSSTLLGIGQN